MTLNYDLLEDETGLPEERKGIAWLSVDADGVGRIVGYEGVTPQPEGTRRIRYSQRRRARVSIGGERYYFQSGTGERYEDADYGIFRVMPDGRALLAGLADEKRRPILTAGEAPSERSGLEAD